MTAGEFRKQALNIPGAIESAHVGHPDFRVGGKVFASLGAPNEDWGMVKLTPEEQRLYSEEAPGVFRPRRGAWGRRGYTNVHLASAAAAKVVVALQAAATNVASHARRRRRDDMRLARRRAADCAGGSTCAGLVRLLRFATMHLRLAVHPGAM